MTTSSVNVTDQRAVRDAGGGVTDEYTTGKLEAGQHNSGNQRQSGMQFTVSIPTGSTIDSVTLNLRLRAIVTDGEPKTRIGFAPNNTNLAGQNLANTPSNAKTIKSTSHTGSADYTVGTSFTDIAINLLTSFNTAMAAGYHADGTAIVIWNESGSETTSGGDYYFEAFGVGESDSAELVIEYTPPATVLGRAVETDVVRSIAVIKPISLTPGRVSEVNTINAVNVDLTQIVDVGVTAESEHINALTIGRSVQLGRAMETNAIRPMAVQVEASSLIIQYYNHLAG